MILNRPLCVDDFGNEVYQCHYTQRFVSIDESIFIGSVIPQVIGKYVCHTIGVKARKDSYRVFCDEIEKNCNTCKNLERTKHSKDVSGFLHGHCKSTPVNHPYQHRFNVYGHMIFHPEDCMKMECYEPR